MKKFLLSIFIIGCVLNISRAQQFTTSLTGFMSCGRSLHQTQVLPNGKVLIFGGSNYDLSNYKIFNTSEVYDPSTNQWVVVAPMNNKRERFASVVLNNGEVMAIGGRNDAIYAQSSCEVYNADSNTWSIVASMNTGRQEHCAIKLQNGNILVVGTDQTAEIYDVARNAWRYTGSLKENRGSGMTLTLLTDGKVLAVGGNNSKKTAEIYDPITGQWRLVASTTTYSREDHSSILLNDSTVLLVGSYDSNICEIFNPKTETFSVVGETEDMRTNNAAILLDNGRVLVFGLGDIFTPADTKVFEVYDSASKTWSHGTYNYVGRNVYTINKLNDGKVLIAGGTFTTGNGSPNTGILVEINSLINDVTKTYAITVDDSKPCYGKDININMSSSQSGVSYTAYIGENKLSNTEEGGSIVNLKIPYNKLSLGKNLIKIKGEKPGSYSECLSQLVAVTTTLENNDIPILSIKDTAICEGSSFTVNAAVSNSGDIIWPDYSVKSTKTYNSVTDVYAMSRDIKGCISLASEIASVTYKPSASNIDAGDDIVVCSFGHPVKLEGIPTSGYWTGSGVVSDSLFNPTIVSKGIYEVEYNYCDFKDTLQVIVKASDSVPDFSVSLTRDSICPNYVNSKLKIENANNDVKYEVYRDNVLVQTYSNSSSFSYDIQTSSVTKNTEFLVKAYFNECSVDTLSKKVTLHYFPLSKYLTCRFVQDSICSGDTLVTYILNPEIGMSYYCSYSANSVISDTIKCTEAKDTLFVPIATASFFPSSVGVHAINGNGCDRSIATLYSQRKINITIDFTLSDEAKLINGSVIATNTSNMDQYQWTCSSGINTLSKTPQELKITTGANGVYKVTLTGISRYNCTRSITKDVVFFNKNQNKTGFEICYSNVLKDSQGNKVLPEKIIASHVDKNGFTYISYYTLVGYYNYDVHMFITKIGPDGSVVWTIEQNEYLADKNIYNSVDNFAAYCNSITTDNIGNVYITGSCRSHQMKFNNIVIPLSEYDRHGKEPRFYCLKFNAAGELIWWIASQESVKSAGADIKYVDDNNIFISLWGAPSAKFTNGTFNIGTGGSQLVRINSNGEFQEKYISTVANPEKAINWVGPDYSYWYDNLSTVQEPKIGIENNHIHLTGRAMSGYGINNMLIQSDSTRVYYDYKLDLAKKTWSNPTKALEEIMPYNGSSIYTWGSYFPEIKKSKYDPTSNAYYFLKGNKLHKVNSLGVVEWKYEFNKTLNPEEFVIIGNTIVVQGSFVNYFLLNNNSKIDGINTGKKKEVFIAKFNTSGGFIGLDHMGSAGDDHSTTLISSPNNEIISIGFVESNLYYNDNLLRTAANDMYYLRENINGLCSVNNYPKVKLTSPIDSSRTCFDTQMKIKWYSLQTGTAAIYYKLENTSQYILIKNNISADVNHYEWTVPTTLYGKRMTIKLTVGSATDYVVTAFSPMTYEETVVNTILCRGVELKYDFGSQYNTYQWVSGGTSSSKTLISPVLDTVFVTNAIGCRALRQLKIVEKKPKLTVKIINSSSQAVTSAIELIKIVDNKPVVVQTSYYNNTYVLAVDAGVYYVKATDGAVPTYYKTDYSGALVLSDAGKITVGDCLDSVVVSLKLIDKKAYSYTSSFYGKYLSESCTGSSKPSVRVYLVNNYGEVLQYATTSSTGSFSFSNFSYDGNNNIVFDDYPVPYKKYPITTSSSITIYYEQDNQIYDCSKVSDLKEEIKAIHFDYTNPVSDQFTVKFSTNSTKASIVLFDMQGAFVMNLFDGIIEKDKEYSITTSLAKLPVGIYLCSFDDGQNGVVTKKVLVAR